MRQMQRNRWEKCGEWSPIGRRKLSWSGRTESPAAEVTWFKYAITTNSRTCGTGTRWGAGAIGSDRMPHMHDDKATWSWTNSSSADFGGSGTTSEISPKSSSCFGRSDFFVQQLPASSSLPLQQPHNSPPVFTSQHLQAWQTVLAVQHWPWAHVPCAATNAIGWITIAAIRQRLTAARIRGELLTVTFRKRYPCTVYELYRKFGRRVQ